MNYADAVSLKHATLGLLTYGPASGYDLLQKFRDSLANVWPATQSQLYGELGKLADAGLVTVAAEGPRGRKEYELTDAGREELRHWLVEVEPNRVTRNESLLRVYFLGAVGPERAREYLANLGETGRRRSERLAELDATIDWGDDDPSRYGRLVLEWGKRFSAMQQEWAEWAVKQVE